VDSLQRMRATLSGGVPDRVPVFPMIVAGTARWAGVPISRFAADPAVMADCLVSGQQRAGYDAIHVSLNVTVEAEAVGAPIEQPYDELPHVTAPIIVEPADLRQLRVPDPLADGRLPVFVDAMRIVAREVGDSAYVTANIRGPMSMASQLRGLEPLLMDLIDAPGFVADLLAFCAEVGTVFAAALIAAGGRAIMLGDALCSPASISPATYRSVAQPVHAEMVRRFLADGAEAVLLHVCGDTRPIIGDLAATGATALDLDTPVPIDEARTLVGPAIGLRGNLDTSRMYLAAPGEIRDAALRAIALGGTRGYILGTGCEVPPGTPIENVIAMVEASNEAAGRGARAGVGD
jgi:MtaA/CmuA family methyltransferase